jgi:hypothetical protein
MGLQYILLALLGLGSLLLCACSEPEIAETSCIQLHHISQRSKTKKVHIAIAFFGLARCWKCTLPSFTRRVFEVLRRQEIEYDIFWHSYDSQSRPSDGSFGAAPDMGDPMEVADLRPMVPCSFSIDSRDRLSEQQFSLYLQAQRGAHLNKRKDIWNDNYYSVKNALLALYSQEQVFALIEDHVTGRRHGIHYDFVLMLRPDTAIIKDIELPFAVSRGQLRMQIQPSTIWLPDFQGVHGYNDRAAMGTPAVMKLFMNRLTAFRTYPKPLINSEAFLKVYLDIILRERYIRVALHPIKVVRVRENGLVAARDSEPGAIALSADDVDYWSCVNATKLPLDSAASHLARRQGDSLADKNRKQVGSFQRSIMPLRCGKTENVLLASE